MTSPRMRQSTVLAVAIGAFLTLGTATALPHPAAQTDPPKSDAAIADAKPASEVKKRRRSTGRSVVPAAETGADRADDRTAKTDSAKLPETNSPALFPLATRVPAEAPPTRKGSALGKMAALYNEGQHTEARVAADAILAVDGSGVFEKAYAAQVAAHIAYGAGDPAPAMAYYQQVISLDALDNNSHYGAMLNLALLQHQHKRYAESVATFDRLISETRSNDPEHLIMKGQGLYSLGKYPDAAVAIKQAIDASPAPNPQWQALLMQTHMKDGKPAAAMNLAEQVAAASPGDKRAQLNLAVAYQQNGRLEQSAAVLQKLRQSGQLTEAAEYEQLYVAHLKLDGNEQQAIEVINEGLQKGILKAEFQPLVALAQSYYFSKQIAPAIDAYQKAAPLDNDGETYLNLARLLWRENRVAEAKDAAHKAVAKGLKQPEAAKEILALPGG